MVADIEWPMDEVIDLLGFIEDVNMKYFLFAFSLAYLNLPSTLLRLQDISSPEFSSTPLELSQSKFDISHRLYFITRAIYEKNLRRLDLPFRILLLSANYFFDRIMHNVIYYSSVGRYLDVNGSVISRFLD